MANEGVTTVLKNRPDLVWILIIGIYLIAAQRLMGTQRYTKRLPKWTIRLLGVSFGAILILPMKYWLQPWVSNLWIEPANPDAPHSFLAALGAVIILLTPAIFHVVARAIVGSRMQDSG